MGTSRSGFESQPCYGPYCVTDRFTVLAIMVNKTNVLPDDIASQVKFMRVHINIFTHLDKRILTGKETKMFPH